MLNDATRKYSAESALPSNTVDDRFTQALTAIELNKLTESPDTRVKTQAVQTQDSLEKFLTATL